MSIVRNIIFLEDDCVSVIRFIADKIEYVKKDGENGFPITADFWEWWKRAVSYIDGEEVDICFVYDKNYDIMHDGIIKKNVLNSEDSCWNLENLKHFFADLKPTYTGLMIIGPNDQECLLSEDKGELPRRLNTNLDFKSYKPHQTNDKVSLDLSEPINEENCTELAQYFVDKVREERGGW